MARKTMLSRTVKRSIGVFCAFAVFALYLVFVLFRMQILEYDSYQQRVIDQITVETSVGAERGKIYDTNMNLLATNTTTWRVFISPVDIQTAKYSTAIGKMLYSARYGMSVEDAQQGRSQDALIASGLSRILDVDYDFVMAKAAKKGRRDETIKASVDKATADAVLEFVDKYDLDNQIHVSAMTKRYYCYDNLAAHVIGFTGTDGQGLYGLELKYDDSLAGTAGKYVTAKDAKGGDMPYDYESYIDAENGLNLITTIDMRIQYALEKQLEATFADSEPSARVTGIVMDVKTGAILAMAVKPDFNLNTPFTLDDYYSALLETSGLAADSDEYNALFRDYQLTMWNNKAITEIYEPGSTFKIITTSMALEENLVTPEEPFYCSGAYVVPGTTQVIHCHKVTGHGAVSFARGLQQSCNPVLMTIADRVGSAKFYEYFGNFGYFDKTGIDLPGEAVSYFHNLANFNMVELATASFGQRFKVTALAQITAVATVANGGYLVTPHLIKGFADDDGNIVYTYEPEAKRQVISEATSKTITQILEEGVSGDGGAKNAYVKGYKVAAKTGTSQKFDVLNEAGESYLRIGSCIAYAPADDPQIAAYIVVDEPRRGSVYGSIVSAPYISALLGEVLPLIGVEPEYTEKELATMVVGVNNYVGYPVESAQSLIVRAGLKYDIVGNGATVVSQMPEAGSSFSKDSGKIILYTGEDVKKTSVTVPDVVGKTAAAANQLLVNSGLNIKIEGAQNYANGTGATVISQSVVAGTSVAKGTVITIELRHLDSTD